MFSFIVLVVIWLVVVGLRAPGRARKLRRGVAAQTAKLAELQALAALPEAEKVRCDEAAQRYEAMRNTVAKDGDTLVPVLISILGLIAFICIIALGGGAKTSAALKDRPSVARARLRPIFVTPEASRTTAQREERKYMLGRLGKILHYFHHGYEGDLIEGFGLPFSP